MSQNKAVFIPFNPVLLVAALAAFLIAALLFVGGVGRWMSGIPFGLGCGILVGALTLALKRTRFVEVSMRPSSKIECRITNGPDLETIKMSFTTHLEQWPKGSPFGVDMGADGGHEVLLDVMSMEHRDMDPGCMILKGNCLPDPDKGRQSTDYMWVKVLFDLHSRKGYITFYGSGDMTD